MRLVIYDGALGSILIRKEEAFEQPTPMIGTVQIQCLGDDSDRRRNCGPIMATSSHTAVIAESTPYDPVQHPSSTTQSELRILHQGIRSRLIVSLCPSLRFHMPILLSHGKPTTYCGTEEQDVEIRVGDTVASESPAVQPKYHRIALPSF